MTTPESDPPMHTSQNTSPAAANGDLKKCPDCAEMVKAEARICRFCRYRFADPPQDSPATPDPPLVTASAPTSGGHQIAPAPSESRAGELAWVFWYLGAVAIWVVTVLPLGTHLETGPLGAAIISLGAAALIRGGYVLFRRTQRFLSPWLFVIAALVALLATAGQTANERDRAGTTLPSPSTRAGERVAGSP